MSVKDFSAYFLISKDRLKMRQRGNAPIKTDRKHYRGKMEKFARNKRMKKSVGSLPRVNRSYNQGILQGNRRGMY